MYWDVVSGGIESSTKLTNYLNKENEIENDYTKNFSNYLDKENEIEKERDPFFTNDERNVTKQEVTEKIDKNRKGIKANEAKFYAMSFSPSEDELSKIIEEADKEARNLVAINVGDFDENKDKIVRDMLKTYTEKMMDEYAKAFNREGINSSKDLVWYGKVEKNRYWKYNDKEVQHNSKILSKIKKLEKNAEKNADKIKALKKDLILESKIRLGGKDIPVSHMMAKSGDNYHVHVIVSRKDKEQKRSLSPLANAKGNNHQKINGKTCTIGFNRDHFANKAEETFDKQFKHYRMFYQSYEGKKAYHKYDKELEALKKKIAEHNERGDYSGAETAEKEYYALNNERYKNFYAEKENYNKGHEELRSSIKEDRKQAWIEEQKSKWEKTTLQERKNYIKQNDKENKGKIAGLSQAQQSAIRVIKENTNSTDHMRIVSYGKSAYKIFKMQESSLMKKQALQLTTRVISDFVNVSSMGSLSLNPITMAISAGKGLAKLLTDNDKGVSK